VISESFDYLCAERLQPDLVWMAEHLARHHELQTSPSLIEQLAKISVSTLRRITGRLDQDQQEFTRFGGRLRTMCLRCEGIFRLVSHGRYLTNR
jgi:hypothetical protein